MERTPETDAMDATRPRPQHPRELWTTTNKDTTASATTTTTTTSPKTSSSRKPHPHPSGNGLPSATDEQLAELPTTDPEHAE
jgi:hypothetical protein